MQLCSQVKKKEHFVFFIVEYELLDHWEVQVFVKKEEGQKALTCTFKKF